MDSSEAAAVFVVSASSRLTKLVPPVGERLIGGSLCNWSPTWLAAVEPVGSQEEERGAGQTGS